MPGQQIKNHEIKRTLPFGHGPIPRCEPPFVAYKCIRTAPRLYAANISCQYPHTPSSQLANFMLAVPTRRTQFVQVLDLGLIIRWTAVPGFRAALDPGVINWDVDPAQFIQPTVNTNGAFTAKTQRFPILRPHNVRFVFNVSPLFGACAYRQDDRVTDHTQCSRCRTTDSLEVVNIHSCASGDK